MTAIVHPLLTDENVHPDVILALREQGKDVRTALEEGLGGRADVDILRRAYASRRVILTHDADFGTLAVRDRESFIGIIYVRPGHISAEFVLRTLASIESSPAEMTPPFIIVAERRGGEIRVRQRSLA